MKDLHEVLLRDLSDLRLVRHGRDFRHRQRNGTHLRKLHLRDMRAEQPSRDGTRLRRTFEVEEARAAVLADVARGYSHVTSPRCLS